MLRFLLLLIIIASGWYYFAHPLPEIPHAPGILVKDPPVISASTAASWQKGDYTIAPTRAYSIDARVLDKTHYFMDREAQLVPYDLALGWQQMSDSAVLSKLSIGQSSRFWHYHWDQDPPMDEASIPFESGNMHIIPGNKEVLDTLANLAIGDIIHIDGFLVDVRGSDGWQWNSPVGVSSEGAHGCKLIWASELSIVQSQ